MGHECGGCGCCGHENVMRCESCGMPMVEAKMHGGEDAKNKNCQYCCDKSGKLKSREEVRKGMVRFYQDSEGKTKEEAEKFVDEYMSKMPAWK